MRGMHFQVEGILWMADNRLSLGNLAGFAGSRKTRKNFFDGAYQ
jgi:hypothetical protein